MPRSVSIPLFLSVSLWRRDARAEVSARVGVSPLSWMASGSGRARTCRTESLPQRRENKREGQPTRTLRSMTGAAPAILCTSPHQRTGRPLFLSFSLRRRDAGVEVSARVHASPLSSMASSLWPCQNVPGRVSPSEEGEQEGGTTGRQPPRRRQVYRPAILCTSPHQRTGFPLFLSFSLRRRDSGAEVSAPAGVSPLPSMVSRIWPCQNVPGRVSPSEEGDQEGGTTGANAPVHDGRSTGNPLQDSEPMPRSTSIPSSCPSPSGEGTQGRRFLLWFRCRLSRRWHLGSDPGRTFRARSLPQRRETKREGQPTRTLRATTGAAPAILCTSPHQRTGLPYPLFLFFSLRRRDAGVEVSALV